MADFSLTLIEKVYGAVIGIGLSAASFLIGRWWGRWKASRQWETKTFLDRIIVSLNSFHQETLQIRTVKECDLKEIFLNQIAIDKVKEASKQTTKENPILPLEKNDRWYILNFVLNAVAEQFAIGFVKRDSNQPTTVVTYLLFLTCELVGDERIRKVRAMLVQKKYLEAFPYSETMPLLENPWHEDRVKTLRAASRLYQTEPDHFLKLEICV